MGIAINSGYNYDCPNNIVTMLTDLVNFNSMGSGNFGINIDSLSQQEQHSNTHIFLSIPVEAEKDSKVFEVAKQLDLIKRSFKLKDKELEKVIKKTRRTIHTWKKTGVIPKDSSSERVYELFLLSSNWVDKGFDINRRQLTKKIINRNSIYDMLTSENIDTQQILFAGNSFSVLSENDDSIELF